MSNTTPPPPAPPPPAPPPPAAPSASLEPSLRTRLAAADAADPLSPLRRRFALPDGVIYLDGNSLGALPAHLAGRVAEVIEEQWGRGLIRSWNDAGWIEAPQRVGAKLAPLLGAAPDEVIVCDSTSLNLAKLLHAAFVLRAGRPAVLTEADGFPTDRYLVERIAEDHGLQVIAVPGEDVAIWLAAHGAASLAAVVVGHVDYRSGARHDLAALAALAQRDDALLVTDVAHSAGLLPLTLAADGVDLAVGCGYKWLNGGPGAPAFAFVARRWQASLDVPLPGWMGHRAPFAFDAAYEPAPDLRRLLVGTPAVLGLAALEAALEVFDGVDLAALHARNVELVELALSLLQPLLAADDDLAVVSPAAASARGGHLALRHRHAAALSSALVERGVIGDHRPPEVLRWAFAPLYLRRVDVYDAVATLAEVLHTRSWDAPQHHRPRPVT